MKRIWLNVEEIWRFDKNDNTDMEYMKKLISKRKNEGFSVFERDPDSEECGEIQCRDITFKKTKFGFELDKELEDL